MCCLEPLGDLLEQRYGFVDGDRPAGEALGQRLAGNELHHEKPLPVRIFEPVQRGDVRMIQGSEQPGLVFEPGDPVFVLGELLGKNLDGDVAAELRILGPIDFPHPARTDLLEDFVDADTAAGFDRHDGPAENSVRPRRSQAAADSSFDERDRRSAFAESFASEAPAISERFENPALLAS